jgi:glycosyltransferase involved in cell wall biosynthesis
MRIAVVLPAWNEAASLPRTIESLRSQSRPPDRLVVVNGGSTDNSREIARSLGADVLALAGRGRGGQIAAGVDDYTDDVVLIAHADMIFPAAALATLQSFLLRYPDCPGGCLGHRFDSERPLFRLIEWWDRRRALRGHSFGDQAQFFRREMLSRAGGFPALPLMEDVELARMLRRLGRPAYLNVPVVVSPRRYETIGWPRVMWTNWRLRRLYTREGPEACWRLFRRYYGYTDSPSPAASR